MDKKRHIGEAPLSKLPDRNLRFLIGDGAVKTKHIADRQVTPEKLSDSTRASLFKEIYDKIHKENMGIDSRLSDKIRELYSMIASLQVGGIALSGNLGSRDDIGISQRALTEILTRIWDKLEDITGESYMGFSMIVDPVSVMAEGSVTVNVAADSSGAISSFENIRIYANGELKAEDSATEVFNATFDIDKTSVIECRAVIAGRVYTRQRTVEVLYPFLMGSGQVFTDIIKPENQKVLEGTLEGAYDVTVENEDEHLFIIIPASRRQEFRRADMNGLGLKVEIPLVPTEYENFVVYKSANTYKAGTYNIDIDINS